MRWHMFDSAGFAKNSTDIRCGLISPNLVSGQTLSGEVLEPSSWAMLIAGFGMTGTAMRRRRAFLAVA